MAVSVADPELEARLSAVQQRIASACERSGRDLHDVKLLAVSKGHGVEAIRAAHALGQREFGENYVQELVRKTSELAGLRGVRFRFIGRLQRNKVKAVLGTGCSVDSVDSLALAQALNAEALRSGRAPLEIMVQVNVDREPQKAGVMPEATLALVDAARALPGLDVRGLMAIPRDGDDPAAIVAAFGALRSLASRSGLAELSMGMSSDLESAIEMGSTMVRVGTAIFGPRPPRGQVPR
jgi:pyridoxal phosphate enzyme (YggS family)